MARLGRGLPFRPALTRRRISIPAYVGLVPFEDSDEFPTLVVSTPNAYVALPPFEDFDEFPDLTLSYGQRFTLPPFEDSDEFPDLTVDTPILPGDAMDGAASQIEWNGFLLGRGTPYKIKTLTGWRSRPRNEASNVPEPSNHGTLDVRPLLGERVVLLTSLLEALPGEVEAAVNALEQALPVLETGEPWPLVINDLGTPYLAYGRINNLDLPVDQLLQLGFGNLVLEWVCSDPRRYNIRQTGINLPVGQTTTLTNAGNVSTFARIRVPGPAYKPTFLNADLGRLLSFNLTVAEGQTLVIDPKRKTAYIGDVTVTGDRTNSSVPIPDFVLGRGPNRILYTTTSGGTTPAVALYRDAWT